MLLLGAPAAQTTTPGLLLPSRRPSASVCPPHPSVTKQGRHGAGAGTSAHRTELSPSAHLVLQRLVAASRGGTSHLLLTRSSCSNLAAAGRSRERVPAAAPTDVLLLRSGPACRCWPGVVSPRRLGQGRAQAAGTRTSRPSNIWPRWLTSCRGSWCHHLHRGLARRAV